MIDPIPVLLAALAFVAGLGVGWYLSRREQNHLKTSFEALAAAALRANSDEFLKLADQKLGNVQKEAIGDLGRRQQALDELVKPIREALTQVDRKLGDTDRGQVQTTTLLRELTQQQERLRGETQNLVRALRTPVVRGRWGEMQLRRVVELAGMLPY